MLKKIKLGQKDIPVPVPLNNLAQALAWVEETLVPKNAMITKIELDRRDVLDIDEKDADHTILEASSNLEIQIESPWELSVKTLDAVRDLAYAIEKRLKEIAVQCWNLRSDIHFSRVRETAEDLELILELVNHINGIMDYSQKEMAPVNGLARLMNRPLKDLHAAIKKCSWRECSYILLNRIEPLLKELVAESENLQVSILSSQKTMPIRESVADRS